MPNMNNNVRAGPNYMAVSRQSLSAMSECGCQNPDYARNHRFDRVSASLPRQLKQPPEFRGAAGNAGRRGRKNKKKKKISKRLSRRAQSVGIIFEKFISATQTKHNELCYPRASQIRAFVHGIRSVTSAEGPAAVSGIRISVVSSRIQVSSIIQTRPRLNLSRTSRYIF